jgi:hypothetical protein
VKDLVSPDSLPSQLDDLSFGTAAVAHYPCLDAYQKRERALEDLRYTLLSVPIAAANVAATLAQQVAQVDALTSSAPDFGKGMRGALVPGNFAPSTAGEVPPLFQLRSDIPAEEAARGLASFVAGKHRDTRSLSVRLQRLAVFASLLPTDWEGRAPPAADKMHRLRLARFGPLLLDGSIAPQEYVKLLSSSAAPIRVARNVGAAFEADAMDEEGAAVDAMEGGGEQREGVDVDMANGSAFDVEDGEGEGDGDGAREDDGEGHTDSSSQSDEDSDLEDTGHGSDSESGGDGLM